MQFVGKNDLVDRLKQSWPQASVHGYRRLNHDRPNLVFGHLCASASLREIAFPSYGNHKLKKGSTMAYRTLSRRGAETQRGHSSRPFTQRVIPAFINASPKFSR